MDLPKYIAMLQSGSLYFPRMDYLGDPLEGYISWAEFERLKRQANASEGQVVLPENASLLDVYVSAQRRTRFEAYINCWHMNSSESEAMWKLYGVSDSAIAIRSTYSRLANSLPLSSAKHEGPYMGVVRYSDFETERVGGGNVLELCMQKRNSFSHEQECRAVIWKHAGFNGSSVDEINSIGARNPIGIAVPVDLAALIDAVIVSPLAPAWFMKLVQDVTERYGYHLSHAASAIRRVPYY